MTLPQNCKENTKQKTYYHNNTKFRPLTYDPSLNTIDKNQRLQEHCILRKLEVM